MVVTINFTLGSSSRKKEGETQHPGSVMVRRSQYEKGVDAVKEGRVNITRRNEAVLGDQGAIGDRWAFSCGHLLHI